MNLRLLRRHQAGLIPAQPANPGGHTRLVWPCCACCARWAPAPCPLAPHITACPACTLKEP